MKKGLLICLMFLSIFIFVGCTRGTTLNLNYDEQINEPQNLEISGTVLSWSSVTDAEGYIVYINDEEAAKVSTNSYDFSSKVENRLIFNVVTRAPRGMQDSAFSASIAYVANKASEISQINSYANTNDMDLPEGFAEEVVNRGLLASEFEAIMDSMQSMTEDLSSVDDMDDYFDVVNDVMEDVVHAEALVSAVVKTVLPDRISNEMVWIQNEIDMYQNMIDEGYYYYDIPYYQARIDELQLQYDTLEVLLYEFETNP